MLLFLEWLLIAGVDLLLKMGGLEHLLEPMLEKLKLKLLVLQLLIWLWHIYLFVLDFLLHLITYFVYINFLIYAMIDNKYYFLEQFSNN